MTVEQFRGCDMKHLFRGTNRKSLLMSRHVTSRYRPEGNNLFPAILKTFSEPLETKEWMNEQKPASPYLVLKLAVSNFARK